MAYSSTMTIATTESRSRSALLSTQNSTIGPDGVQEVVRYVEVPMVEEVITTVPKRETVEIEKRYERKKTEYLDRVVEIPAVRRVKKIVEIPTRQEVIKNVRRKEVVPVPKEVIKYVTRKETRVVEEEKKVKGEIVEVPKIIDVIKEVIVPRYHDSEVPTVVSQIVVPIVTDEGETEYIEAVTYEPYLVPVDLYIPLPVDRPVICEGKVKESFQKLDIPAPQYNLLLRNLNSGIIRDKQIYKDMPFRAESDGSIHFLHSNSDTSNISRQASIGASQFPMTTKCENNKKSFQELESKTAVVYEPHRSTCGTIDHSQYYIPQHSSEHLYRQQSSLMHGFQGQSSLVHMASSNGLMMNHKSSGSRSRQERSTSASGTRRFLSTESTSTGRIISNEIRGLR